MSPLRQAGQSGSVHLLHVVALGQQPSDAPQLAVGQFGSLQLVQPGGQQLSGAPQAVVQSGSVHQVQPAPAGQQPSLGEALQVGVQSESVHEVQLVGQQPSVPEVLQGGVQSVSVQ